MGPYIDAQMEVKALARYETAKALTAPRPRRIIIAEDATMARTTDSARFEGFVIAVNGRWDGYLRTGYLCPLDPGSMINVVDRVLFISGISPVTATGGTEIYPPASKGEKAGGRES